MATAPTPITPYGAPPGSNDPANFDARADAKVAQDVIFVGEANALAANVFANAEEAFECAEASDAAALIAGAAAQGAMAAAGAALWVSQNYASGARAVSTLDGQLYRRRAPGGASPTDPKNDPTNWTRDYVVPQLVTAASLFLASN